MKKLLLFQCLATILITEADGQKPKVIFSIRDSFYCSNKYTKIQLQKDIAAFTRVDSAFEHIKGKFNEQTDHFALICPTCSTDKIPLFKRFPEPKEKPKKQDDNPLRTARVDKYPNPPQVPQLHDEWDRGHTFSSDKVLKVIYKPTIDWQPRNVIPKVLCLDTTFILDIGLWEEDVSNYEWNIRVFDKRSKLDSLNQAQLQKSSKDHNSGKAYYCIIANRDSLRSIKLNYDLLNDGLLIKKSFFMNENVHNTYTILGIGADSSVVVNKSFSVLFVADPERLVYLKLQKEYQEQIDLNSSMLLEEYLILKFNVGAIIGLGKK